MNHCQIIILDYSDYYLVSLLIIIRTIDNKTLKLVLMHTYKLCYKSTKFVVSFFFFFLSCLEKL